MWRLHNFNGSGCGKGIEPLNVDIGGWDGHCVGKRSKAYGAACIWSKCGTGVAGDNHIIVQITAGVDAGLNVDGGDNRIGVGDGE